MLSRLRRKLARHKQLHKKITPRRKMQFEALEPRILLSADLGIDQGGVLAGAMIPAAIEQPLEELTHNPAPARAADVESSPVELILVDSTLTDYQGLIDEITGGANGNSAAGYKIHLINGTASGIAQVSELLNNYNQVNALHLLTHGSDGEFILGASTLNSDSLDYYRDQLGSWSGSLSFDADIFLYGCNIAAGETGINFITSLSKITGADVAASDDATGAGSNWILERHTGVIDSPALALDGYQFRLGDMISTPDDEILSGTVGADTFIFQEEVDSEGNTQSWGVDIINQDLSGGNDRVDFSAVAADLNFTFTAADAFTVVDEGGNSLNASEIVTIISGSGDDTLDFSQMVNASGEPVDLVFVIRADGRVTITDAGYTVETNGNISLSEATFEINATGIENLIGGTAADSFVFEDGAVLPGTIDGSNGITDDLLDYSAYSTAVTVDLGAGVITGAAAVSRVQHVIGSQGSDTLTGDGFQNRLTGGAGNDQISGGDEDDILVGGNGNDRLIGGAGNDDLTGGSGDDTLIGGSGDDRLGGGTGVNIIAGDIGRDTLIETADADMILSDSSVLLAGVVNTLSGVEEAQLTGGAGANRLDAAAFSFGPVMLDGGDGDDILIGTADKDTLIGGGGDDRLTGGTGEDVLDGGAGSDTVIESRNADFILTDYTDNNDIVDDAMLVIGAESELLASIENAELTAGASDNLFDLTGFTLGTATLTGAAGTNTLDYSLSAEEITYTFSSLTALTALDPRAGNSVIAADISIIKGGSGIDTLDFSELNTDLVFVIRADGTVSITDGGYTINADGTVSLSGGGTVITASAINGLIGGSGNTTFVFEDKAEIVGTLDGGLGGVNLLDYSAFTDLNVHVNMLRGDADGTTGSASNTDGISRIHNVITGSGNDEITGSDAANVIITGAGADTISGGAGNDIINAGAGDDSLAGGAGSDELIGGTGNDILEAALDATSMVLDNDSLTTVVTGVTTIDSLSGIEEAALTGGASNNLLDAANFTLGSVALYGEAGDDELIGSSGDDYLSGGAGSDTITGGTGVNTLIEVRDVDFILTNSQLTIGSETDTISGITHAELTGGDSANTIDASAFSVGNVILDGGAGDDILRGGSGDDLLTGGAGLDQLYGNAGVDTVAESADSRFILTDSSLDMSEGVNEEVTLTLDNTVSSGTFTLSYEGETTAPIAYDADAQTLEQALAQLDSLTFQDISVSRDRLAIDLTTTLTDLNDGNGVAVSPEGTADLSITLSDGATIVEIDLDAATNLAGILDLISASHVRLTADMNDAGTAIDIKDNEDKGHDIIISGLNDSTAADDLGILGTGDGTTYEGAVLTNLFGPWVITFTVNKAGLDVAEITADHTGLTGGDLAVTTIQGNTLVNSLDSIEKAELIGGLSGNIMDAAGFSGSAILYGGSGDDTLTGGSGADELYGGRF